MKKEYKKRNWHTTILDFANQASKVTYISNLLPIFQLFKYPFLTPFRKGKYICMPILQKWKARHLA